MIGRWQQSAEPTQDIPWSEHPDPPSGIVSSPPSAPPSTGIASVAFPKQAATTMSAPQAATHLIACTTAVDIERT